MLLLPGSFALDRGVTVNTPTNDQRGFARPVGIPSDVGAVEDRVPSVSNFSESDTVETTLSFSVADFTNNFTESSDLASPLLDIRIDTLPPASAGTLELSGGDVTLGQVIPVAQLDELTYTPLEGGVTTFTWDGTDGHLYATSDAAVTLNIAASPTGTLSPSNDTVTVGQTATFTAAATGTPAPTVQWYDSTDGGASFSMIPGATSTTLTFTTAASENGDLYEAVFTNSVGSATTTPAALLDVLTLPTITLSPSNDTVTAGATATFTATATGNPSPTVQWYDSINGGAFMAISGATSTTLSFTSTASDDGNVYEAVFTNAVGSVTTSTATLDVQTLPTVTLSPSNDTVTAFTVSIQSVPQATATFTAAATGNPNPTVQWYDSVNGGAFMALSGATSDTLSFTATAAQNGNLYEAVFSNSVGSATTTAASLTFQSAPEFTSGMPIFSVTMRPGLQVYLHEQRQPRPRCFRPAICLPG